MSFAIDSTTVDFETCVKDFNGVGYDIEVNATVNLHSKGRPATYWDPAEPAEMEVIEVVITFDPEQFEESDESFLPELSFDNLPLHEQINIYNIAEEKAARVF